MALRGDQEWMIEFWIFFDLCKRGRRADVEQVYIAIQSAIAYQQVQVNVGPVLAKIRPPGYPGLNDGYDPGIGMCGLAHFHWLFETELKEIGRTNYHVYRFTRRHDGAVINVELKTASDPENHHAQADYADELKRLTKRRENILVTKRYGTTTEFLFGA